MLTHHSTRRLLLTFSMACVTITLYGQAAAPPATQQKPFEPTVGQQGKDVVWVPTPQALVDKMLDLAKVTPQDFVIDLGSGDGRTVITAAKRGARGAWASNTTPTWSSCRSSNAAAAGRQRGQGEVHESRSLRDRLLPGDRHHDVPAAVDQPQAPAEDSRHEAGHACRVEHVHDGGLAAGRDREHSARDCTSWCTALFWIVPAKVEGTWQMPAGDLVLTQQFQKVSGTLGSSAIADGKLRGDEISFTVGNAHYTGHVNGTSMKGSVTGGNGTAWTATRR